MNRYSKSPRTMTLLAVLLAASALGGCNRREDTQTRTDAMNPAATAVGDTALTAAVKSSLAADTGLSGSDVGVETRDGQVTLSGKAADGAARERAVKLATAVKGVVAVNDQMTTAR